MHSKRLFRRSVVLGCVTALALPVAAQAADRTMYGVDEEQNLVKFKRNSTKDVRSSKEITGLPMGEELVGIDFRPKTGDLYGVGSDDNIYRVNPRTAIAIAESGSSFSPNLDGDRFGVDFNPTSDAIRIVSDEDQSLRCMPDPNTCTQDGDINRGSDDPNVVGSAYTMSSFSFVQPGSTVLYAADSDTDAIYQQNPPNDGTLVDEEPVDFNMRSRLGFDIAGTNDVGYVTTATNSKTKLYRVDIRNGDSKELGRVGDDVTLIGLAADQDRAN